MLGGLLTSDLVFILTSVTSNKCNVVVSLKNAVILRQQLSSRGQLFHIMSRFQTVTESDLQQLQVQQNAANTDRSTAFGVKLFHTYLNECGIPNDLVNITPEDLNSHLERFYAAVRKEDGEYYKLNSMKSVRSSIQRRYIEICQVDIVDDNRFTTANNIFSNICKRIKDAGKGDTDHYPEMEPEDVQKLCASFNVDDQTGLQEKVWFDIQLYLIRRGREGLRAMTKKTFGVFVDSTGRRFFAQVLGESDKNHGINDCPSDTTGEGRLYATGTSLCPVKCFEKYLSHLHPAQDALWQRPLDKVNKSIWYCNAAIGEKTLGGMLAKMSLKYGLSQRYTNHSIRVTSMQILDDNMVDGRHIQRVSGHKSLESVQLYGRRLSTSRKRDISNIFSRAVGNGHIPIQPRPSSSLNSGEQEIIGHTPPAPTMRDRGFQIDGNLAPVPNSVSFQESMGIQQSRIQHQLNLPNFSPSFSLLPSFDKTATTTSSTFAQHQQPIYNMGTINIHNHYSTPCAPLRRKRLRIMSDSEDDE